MLLATEWFEGNWRHKQDLSKFLRKNHVPEGFPNSHKLLDHTDEFKVFVSKTSMFDEKSWLRLKIDFLE